MPICVFTLFPLDEDESDINIAHSNTPSAPKALADPVDQHVATQVQGTSAQSEGAEAARKQAAHVMEVPTVSSDQHDTDKLPGGTSLSEGAELVGHGNGGEQHHAEATRQQEISLSQHADHGHQDPKPDGLQPIERTQGTNAIVCVTPGI